MLRKMLPLLFLLLSGTARADWYEASTQHFVVYSDQRPEGIREFAANLERFDMAVRKFGGWKDEPMAKPKRLTVYVVGSREEVARLAGNRFVAGFYKPHAGGAFAIVPRRAGSGRETDLDAESILLHEYTHHLMMSLSPHSVYPAWFIEGFAELFATADFQKNGDVVLGRPPQYRARTLMTGNNLPIDKMLAADTLKLSTEQRTALYGRGWLLSHYFLIARQRPGQLAAYFAALNAGRPSLEAARAFGDLRTLDSELERYKRGKIAAFLVSGLPRIEVELRALTDGEAATMDARIRSKNGVNRKTAPGVYTDAQKAAAAFPNDAGAQIVLAEAAYDARDLAAAEAAADRAIAANPAAGDAYVYKAMTRITAASIARDRSKETLAAIRKIIATGNKLEPEDPRLLILYYRSFVDFGFPPSENAKEGLAAAFDLAPQDDRLRFNAARMYLKDGDKARARAMLAPLAYDPHGKDLAQRAAAMIATIDKGDVEGAIKSLESNEGSEEKDGEEKDDPPATPTPPPGT
jgi:tetratricopeptide (TPR) repeat protein